MVKKVKKVTTTTTVTTEIIDETQKSLSVYILFDRSGSMYERVCEAVGSTNAYVRALPPETKVTIASFDDINPFDVVRSNVSVSEYVDLRDEEVTPRGMTPLYDSTGRMFNRVLADSPERAVVVIQTDGGENNSKEFTLTAVKEKIKELGAKHYEVVFLGNDFNGVEDVSSSYGFAKSKSLNRTAGNYNATSAMLAQSTMSYASRGTAINFSDQDKKAAEGIKTTGKLTLNPNTLRAKGVPIFNK
ncbi:MAG: hypothetical protein P4L79_10570 [Legionella sp.]|uniref:hypothetical protein n=1 Tax=Legionella sp. TaxID=459 RepID=UPI0028504048|nr:hypothetical protein [Legionella sp.]